MIKVAAQFITTGEKRPKDLLHLLFPAFPA